MALKELPGGELYQDDGGSYANEATARRHEAIHRQLVAGAAAGAKAEADAARAVYSATPLGPTDLNTLTTPQRRAATLSTEVDAPNAPWPGRRALYVVEATPDGSTVVQCAFELQGARRAERVRFGGAWSPWAAPGAGVTVVENTAQDLNALTAPGDYVLVRSTVVAGMKNAPAAERLRVTVGGSVVGPYLVQSATGLVSGGVWSRTLDAGTWTPWQRLDGTPTATVASLTSPGLANALLLEDFTRRRGGEKTVTTGAVALRFDDGLNAFNDKVRPLLEARGLPYSLAVCSGRWAHPENNAVTPAMVQSWLDRGLPELWNHGLTHAGATTEAGWRKEIVDGLAELRRLFPTAQIDGFAVPGTAGTGYGDFKTGASVAEFYGTPAGRLILEHHAVSTGYIPGTANRLMDGRPRQGMSHTTLDGATLTGARSVVTAAQRDHTGAQFMLHPTALDQAGKLSTAGLTALLDHIVAERDAGRLAVLRPYDLMVARYVKDAPVTVSPSPGLTVDETMPGVLSLTPTGGATVTESTPGILTIGV